MSGHDGKESLLDFVLRELFSDKSDTGNLSAPYSSVLKPRRVLPLLPVACREDSDSVVARGQQSYWMQRGWVSDGAGTYTGYYRTMCGSFRGRAEISPSGRMDLYIRNPPDVLREHPHWVCFHQRPGGWYWIHNYGIKDLSSAVLAIEQLLTEAYSA